MLNFWLPVTVTWTVSITIKVARSASFSRKTNLLFSRSPLSVSILLVMGAPQRTNMADLHWMMVPTAILFLRNSARKLFIISLHPARLSLWMLTCMKSSRTAGSTEKMNRKVWIGFRILSTFPGSQDPLETAVSMILCLKACSVLWMAARTPNADRSLRHLPSLQNEMDLTVRCLQ